MDSIRQNKVNSLMQQELANIFLIEGRNYLPGGLIVGIGIGAAGFTSSDRRTVRFAPNIDWIDEPLAEHISALVDLPVVVENDANAAAWGEFTFGAGEDTDDLLLVTVGTGVGGGIVHHGQLYRGGFGIAAEIGHMRIVPDGVACGCGQRGCFEQYASGSALVRNARERVTNGDPGTAALKALADGDLSKITGPALTDLAHDGDVLSIELLAELGHRIGEGLAILASILAEASRASSASSHSARGRSFSWILSC